RSSISTPCPRAGLRSSTPWSRPSACPKVSAPRWSSGCPTTPAARGGRWCRRAGSEPRWRSTASQRYWVCSTSTVPGPAAGGHSSHRMARSGGGPGSAYTDRPSPPRRAHPGDCPVPSNTSRCVRVEASEGFDESAAVMAHGLLASVGIITTAADTLRRHYERLDDNRREALFDMIMTQGSHLEGVLKD